MKVKLTKKFVDTVAYENKGHKDYLDTELTGFILRVGKTTKKYRLYKRINGKLYKDLVDDASIITVGDASEHTIIAEHLMKYTKTVPSLALIFHLIDCIEFDDDLGWVTLTALKTAIKWQEMLDSYV